eukprot:GFYU01041591.1.p1 GENE.GFYU01041591.1~~GFYU01041591.1.p1  ORF type:complete len:238 (+),score=15.78 GFYU01041591.1:61-774(+)
MGLFQSKVRMQWSRGTSETVIPFVSQLIEKTHLYTLNPRVTMLAGSTTGSVLQCSYMRKQYLMSCPPVYSLQLELSRLCDDDGFPLPHTRPGAHLEVTRVEYSFGAPSPVYESNSFVEGSKPFVQITKVRTDVAGRVTRISFAVKLSTQSKPWDGGSNVEGAVAELAGDIDADISFEEYPFIPAHLANNADNTDDNANSVNNADNADNVDNADTAHHAKNADSANRADKGVVDDNVL